jgi:dephospho-CoA kinase
MIIGVTGRRLSGKSTIAEHLGERHGFTVLCFTEDLLKPILIKRKMPVNRRSLTFLGQEIRKKHGSKDALVRLLCEKISPGKNYAIAGIRFPEEVRYLRRVFGKDFILLAAYASTKTRFHRARSSMRFKESVGGRSGHRFQMTMKDFLEIERLPTEKIIPTTMRMADLKVNNDASKDLRKNIDKVMGKLREA